MSLSSFLAAISAGADRTAKIAILASETDVNTGIIDDTTEVSKAYWEGQGGSSDTGQAYAAILDLMLVLSGQQTYTSLNLNNKVKFTAGGLMLNADGTPVDGVEISRTGEDILLKGPVVASEGVDLTGDFLLDGDMTFSTDTGLSLNLRQNTLTVYDDIIPASPADTPVIQINDGDGAIFLWMPYDAARYELPTPESSKGQRSVGAWTWYHLGDVPQDSNTRAFAAMTLDYAADLCIGHLSSPTWGREWNEGYQSFVQYYDLPEGGSRYGSEHKLISTQATGRNRITFQGGFDEDDPDDDNGTSVFELRHWFYPAQGGSDYLAIAYLSSLYTSTETFKIVVDDTNNEQEIQAKACFKAPAGPWAALNFRVLSGNDFDIHIAPNLYEHLANRGTPGEPVPAIRMTNGNLTYSYGRLGFDSWENDAAFRMHLDDINGSLRGVIAIGPPYGTIGAPYDPLVYVPESDAIGIMIDNIWLKDFQSARTGLWIGKYCDTYAGRIYLQDTSGHRASILMGTDQEHTYLFMKDEVLLTAPGSSTESDLGETGALGSHNIPWISVAASITPANQTEFNTLMAGIEAAIDPTQTGSMAMVYSTLSSTVALFVFGPYSGSPQLTAKFQPVSTYTYTR